MAGRSHILAEITNAFTPTMHQGGKRIADEALTEATTAIEGFPLMLQFLGYHAWNLTGEESTITTTTIRQTIRIAQTELEKRVFEATMYDLTPQDEALLLAMLDDDTATRQADL